jgi:hypothetical protein
MKIDSLAGLRRLKTIGSALWSIQNRLINDLAQRTTGAEQAEAAI